MTNEDGYRLINSAGLNNHQKYVAISFLHNPDIFMQYIGKFSAENGKQEHHNPMDPNHQAYLHEAWNTRWRSLS